MNQAAVQDSASRVSGIGRTRLDDPKAELARLRDCTFWQAFEAAAEADPDHIALIGAGDAGDISRISYRDLLARIRNFSGGLASIGVRRGDRVGLWMTNNFEWVVAAFGATRIGATLVPVNTFLKPPEIKYFLEQSGCRHLIMIDGFRKLVMPDLLEEMIPGVKAQTEQGFVFSDDLPDLRTITLWRRNGGNLDCAYDFAVLEAPSAEALALADRMESRVRGSDLGMIKYTSGSTAFPKGVMLEQGGIIANAVLHARRMPTTSDDIYFSMMPFFHAGGSIFGLLTMLTTGGTLLFTETFDAEIGAELMMHEKPTIQATMLASEMMHAGKAKGYVFDSLRFASWPDEVSREMQPNAEATFCSFGLTETYGTACFSRHAPDDMGNAKPTPLEGNEIRIIDPDTGDALPAGIPGEALISGNLARGYWNKPVETAKAFRDGWLHTEDRCSVDEQGRVTWHGRIKLMLKIGGENVSIEEVERVVGSHEAVLACGVVGVADKRKGEAVCLYLSRVAGSALEEAELRHWLKTRLAHFKLPREVVFLDELPHLGSGKVDRVTLRKWAMEAFPA